jgi:hypothetical protein
MNAVEIEEAISALAEQPFDSVEFPFAFLQAFGNKDTTLKRLRSGASNKSDIGGVLQTNNVHIAVAAPGEVTKTLAALKASPATIRAKAKFVLATDGDSFEAEDLASGATVACTYADFPDHFGFFLPLAGITTVREISENAFDIRATSRLNRLYVELLKDNPEWGAAERRHDMNHFMARLIFCFFAQRTDIFIGDDLFTAMIEQMSARDSSNTQEVIGELFRAMNTKIENRVTAKIPRWADAFPYVNGELFSGSIDVPRFSRIARSYLLHIGGLDWTKINPDIFGSMIQAVAEDEERGALGMHYTSVPNILKVLNPLFLDDLRAQLEEARDNPRMLLNLRKRIAKIRVFDPACGSGNFLVIAYKEMREIEAEINRRRDEGDRRTEIPLTNFRGIELRDFPAEIARLALIIAEFQCDVLYRGQKEALAEFLPLDAQNWITRGNALRLDWLSVCPATGAAVKHQADDLFHTPLDQAQIDFENEGGETYICGNPPYAGSNWQSQEQKEDLRQIFESRVKSWKLLDYISAWFFKAAEFGTKTDAVSAFVTTNSINQGQLASILWPLIFETGHEISFAHTSFKWANLATNNAGVTVAIVAISNRPRIIKKIYSLAEDGTTILKEARNINPYLIAAPNIFIEPRKSSIALDAQMTDGCGALDGGHLILDSTEIASLLSQGNESDEQFIRPYTGSSEFIRGIQRWCLWIEDRYLDLALQNPDIERRVKQTEKFRSGAGTRAKSALSRPHKFAWINQSSGDQIVVPKHFSERRDFVTAGFMSNEYIVSNSATIIHDASLDIFSIISSKLHIVWVKAIAGRLREDIRYTPATCHNTFPIPVLTEKNKSDLVRCAEEILLTREAHFPTTIADLYDPNSMPADLREAHERNDEVLERIYIGRRFRNDTERLERLFDLYTKMIADHGAAKTRRVEASA